MEELYKIELHMKRNKISKKELANISGYTYNQIRRMFKGSIKLKEIADLKTALDI